MHLELRRVLSTADCTLGYLWVDGGFECFSLEDPVREIGPNGEGKVPGSTAIPAGTYPVVVNTSQRFGRLMPRLLQVPHFDGILIHKGNTAEDTHGCILVGREILGDNRLVRSTEAFDHLFPQLVKASQEGQEIDITITDAFRGAEATDG